MQEQTNKEQLSIRLKDIHEQYHTKQTYDRTFHQWPVLLQEERLQAWWVGMLPGLIKTLHKELVAMNMKFP